MQDIITRMRAKKADEGFTLIELLVVVVIIGVLVAIAIPVYLNYREGAADKSAQSDVRATISAIEQYYTDNQNKYPAALADVQATKSNNTTLTYVPVGVPPSSYLLCANNTGGSDKVYLYDSTKGGPVDEADVDVATCKP